MTSFSSHYSPSSARQRSFDASAERGRVAPLGGLCSPRGFAATHQKVTDRPNAFARFSKRPPSAVNASVIGASADGLITAIGGTRRERSCGRRVDPENAVPGCSAASIVCNDGPVRAGAEHKEGFHTRQTGYEQFATARREYAEAHPRRLLRGASPLPRDQGDVPFITGNGLVGFPTPRRTKKNEITHSFDQPPEQSPVSSPIEVATQMQSMRRYASPYRPPPLAQTSVVYPESLPMDFDLKHTGAAKVQRFAPSRRHDPSLQGVLFQPPSGPAKPYQLKSPFHRED